MSVFAKAGVTEKAGSGLKEAKNAMDYVYPYCTTYDEVVGQAVRWLANPASKGNPYE